MASVKSLRALVFVVGVSCGKSTSSAPPKPLPATAAGTSSSVGPGIPAGFTGTVRNSIELSDEVHDAIAKANELSNARAEQARIPLRGAP